MRLAVSRGLGRLVADLGQTQDEAGDAGLMAGVLDVAAVLTGEAPGGGQAEAAAAAGGAA